MTDINTSIAHLTSDTGIKFQVLNATLDDWDEVATYEALNLWTRENAAAAEIVADPVEE